MLQSKVYFPYLPRQEALRQRVPVTFPQRGVYRQDTFRIVTRFPFGFLQKARRLELKKEVLVYPNVETVADFAEILPASMARSKACQRPRPGFVRAPRIFTERQRASRPLESVRASPAS